MSGLVTEMEFEALPELRAPQAAFEKGQVIIGKPRPAILQEALDLIQKLNLGPNDANKLTDALFFKRHPERAGRPLKKSEGLLIREWSRLREVALAAISITFLRAKASNSSALLPIWPAAAWAGSRRLSRSGGRPSPSRQAINRGLPPWVSDWASGKTPWRQAASWLGDVLPRQEYEWESSSRSTRPQDHPDAMLDTPGHVAAETHKRSEEALTGGPPRASLPPRRRPMRATPGLVCGLAGRACAASATRPLVRVVPASCGTASIAQDRSGVPVTPQAAVRAPGGQTSAPGLF
jgi:hypothetical protein